MAVGCVVEIRLHAQNEYGWVRALSKEIECPSHNMTQSLLFNHWVSSCLGLGITLQYILCQPVDIEYTEDADLHSLDMALLGVGVSPRAEGRRGRDGTPEGGDLGPTSGRRGRPRCGRTRPASRRLLYLHGGVGG